MVCLTEKFENCKQNIWCEVFYAGVPGDGKQTGWVVYKLLTRCTFEFWFLNDFNLKMAATLSLVKGGLINTQIQNACARFYTHIDKFSSCEPKYLSYNSVEHLHICARP